jgi:type IV pilus assembly protein PilX
MLLLVVTLLGLASMRGALMQERMAANTVARAMAFQAAESGLRQAELIARDGTVTFPSSGCSAGRCSNPGTGAGAWDTSGFWTSGTGFQTGTAVGSGVGALVPKFVIEDFGQASSFGGPAASGNIDASVPAPIPTGGKQGVYRITAYAATPNGAEVMLQSLYRR